MKRFRFSLERLLGLKQQQERQAELGQLQARLRWETAQRTMLGLRDQLSHTAELLATKMTGPLQRRSRVTQCEVATQIGESLQRAEEQCRVAAGELQKAARERMRLHCEVQALEKLRDRQWRDYLRDAQREAQIKIDEFVLRSWDR